MLMTRSMARRLVIYIHDFLNFFVNGLSGTLQYLDWTDVRHYVEAFALQASHFVGERDYIVLFHNKLLSASDGESKKAVK